MSASKWTFSSSSSLFAALLLGVCAALAQLPPKPVVRSWTPKADAPFEAAIVSFDGQTAELKPAAGQTRRLHRRDLSPEDIVFLDEWSASQPFRMPDTIGVDGTKLPVEVVKEDEKAGIYVYRTPHFEFTCEGRLVAPLLRDVARNFEATRELVKALPWGIVPEPEGGDRFKALLVRSRIRYAEEGAPEGSSGVYMRARKKFIIPFESLGIRPQGRNYTKNVDYSSDTLVHELTHQMMHASLWFLPQWVIEGTAEYTNILPLRNGTFRVAAAKSGLRDYIGSLQGHGGVPEPYPLDKLFWITNEEWNQALAQDPAASQRLYFTSYLLVYYFMHLDGDGSAALFRRYMREIGRHRRAAEDYFAEVEEFKKQPDVETLPDGSLRWRGDLKAPVEPDILASGARREQIARETLDILLDGRTSDQLMEQIRSAYRRVGVRL